MTSLLSPTSLGKIPFISMEEGWTTVVDLSHQLGFRPATIRKWAKIGKLPGIKIGDDWRFPSSIIMMEGGAMGRRKQGYTAPKYLFKRKDSPFWWMKFKDICRSTETEDLGQAQLILAREQERWWAKKVLQKDEGITFPRLINRYLEEITPTKRSPQSDRTNARKPLEFFQDKPINLITVQEVYRYQDWRKVQYVTPKKEGIEPTRLITGATINREVALIKHALHKAVRWGYLERSPLPEGEVEGLHEEKRERYITDEEFQDIRENCGGITERILGVLYFTAQRVGRILDLEWRQIDLGNRQIRFIRQSENKRVAEVIYINAPLLVILKAQWEERKRTVISPYVFCHRNGQPFRSIKSAWKTACRKAGVMDARIHDIRHKAITDMARAGIPKQMIQKAVGHAQGSTTERYTHLQVEDVRVAFEALK